MSGPTVIKVGGSILRTTKDHARVAQALLPHIDQGPTWVVVSAPQGLTERLLKLAREPNHEKLRELIEDQRLRSGLPRNPALEHALEQGLAEVATGNPASLVAWGEQASAAALRSCLNALGVDCPIVELQARTRPAPWRDAIVPGFYLRDRKGRARLLPRGGSDISALLLAHWLDAQEVHLWKQGGGIRDGERTLPNLSPEETLQRVGRTISPIHPAAVRLAQHSGIDIVLEDPWGQAPSTRIHARPLVVEAHA